MKSRDRVTSAASACDLMMRYWTLDPPVTSHAARHVVLRRHSHELQLGGFELSSSTPAPRPALLDGAESSSCLPPRGLGGYQPLSPQEQDQDLYCLHGLEVAHSGLFGLAGSSHGLPGDVAGFCLRHHVPGTLAVASALRSAWATGFQLLCSGHRRTRASAGAQSQRCQDFASVLFKGLEGSAI